MVRTQASPAWRSGPDPRPRLGHVTVERAVRLVALEELAFDQALDALLDDLWWGRSAARSRAAGEGDARAPSAGRPSSHTRTPARVARENPTPPPQHQNRDARAGWAGTWRTAVP